MSRKKKKQPELPMTEDGAIKVTNQKTIAHVNGHANGAAAKVAAPPKPRQVTRYIDHRLTPAEKVQRGVEHRKILALIDDAKASAKEDASEHKSRVNALQEQERAKRIAADTGVERRSVLCEERRNEQLHQIDTVRLDTGKVVDSRAMSAEERQLVIPGTESDKPAAAADTGKKKRGTKMGAQTGAADARA